MTGDKMKNREWRNLCKKRFALIQQVRALISKVKLFFKEERKRKKELCMFEVQREEGNGRMIKKMYLKELASKEVGIEISDRRPGLWWHLNTLSLNLEGRGQSKIIPLLFPQRTTTDRQGWLANLRNKLQKTLTHQLLLLSHLGKLRKWFSDNPGDKLLYMLQYWT